MFPRDCGVGWSIGSRPNELIRGCRFRAWHFDAPDPGDAVGVLRALLRSVRPTLLPGSLVERRARGMGSPSPLQTRRVSRAGTCESDVKLSQSATDLSPLRKSRFR